MAAYTAQQQQEIIERYRPAILKQVRRYRGHRFPMVSEEDLYQDGVETVLRYLRKQDATERFVFPTYDVRAKVLQSEYRSLPVSYGKTKDYYVERLKDSHPALGLKEELIGDDYDTTDLDYRIDFTRFRETLSDNERNLMDLVFDGYGWEEAAQIMGLSRSGGYYLRTQIKEKYDNMMR